MPPAATFLNHLNQSVSLLGWLGLCFTRGNLFPKLRLKLFSDIPWSSMGVLSFHQWGTVFVQDFTYCSQQLFYTCTSPGRERTESLVFVNSCIWSHALISNWTLCFCGEYLFLISPPSRPCRENRRSLCIHFCKWKRWDHIITGLQSTLWLHSPGKKKALK